MRPQDYEDTIAEIQAEHDRGEYQDDPEMAGRRASREQQEALDGRQPRRRESRASMAEQAFRPGTLSLRVTDILDDPVIRGAAQNCGYQASRWLGPDGPLAIPDVHDDQPRYQALIDLWSSDPATYERRLRNRGLIR